MARITEVKKNISEGGNLVTGVLEREGDKLLPQIHHFNKNPATHGESLQ